MRALPETVDSPVIVPGLARESGDAHPTATGVHRSRLALVTAAAAALAVLAALGAWPRLFPAAASDVLRASGRIEGREITVAAKTIQGRIARLLADEGDRVAKGALLAELDAAQLDAQADAAASSLAALDAQVQQATLDVAYTTRNSAATVAAAAAAVSTARAHVTRAAALVANAAANHRRARVLADAGAISPQELEAADTVLRTSGADLAAANEEVARAEANLAVALASRDAIALKREQQRALEGSRRAAAARLREAQATVAERRIVAPQDGTIVSRPVEVGDVVNPGSPVFRMVDMKRLYLKVYVPERDLGRLRLGDPAEIFVDAFPGRAFAGRISRIHEEAEFTPKNVETAEERLKLVFGVEIAVTGADGAIKPGMPADCVIRAGHSGPERPGDGS